MLQHDARTPIVRQRTIAFLAVNFAVSIDQIKVLLELLFLLWLESLAAIPLNSAEYWIRCHCGLLLLAISIAGSSSSSSSPGGGSDGPHLVSLVSSGRRHAVGDGWARGTVYIKTELQMTLH